MGNKIEQIINNINNIKDISGDGKDIGKDGRSDYFYKRETIKFIGEIKKSKLPEVKKEEYATIFFNALSNNANNRLNLFNIINKQKEIIKKEINSVNKTEIKKEATKEINKGVIGTIKNVFYGRVGLVTMDYPDSDLTENSAASNFGKGVIDELFALPEFIAYITEDPVGNGKKIIDALKKQGLKGFIEGMKKSYTDAFDSSRSAYDRGRSSVTVLLTFLGIGGLVKGVAKNSLVKSAVKNTTNTVKNTTNTVKSAANTVKRAAKNTVDKIYSQKYKGGYADILKEIDPVTATKIKANPYLQQYVEDIRGKSLLKNGNINNIQFTKHIDDLIKQSKDMDAFITIKGIDTPMAHKIDYSDLFKIYNDIYKKKGVVSQAAFNTVVKKLVDIKAKRIDFGTKIKANNILYSKISNNKFSQKELDSLMNNPKLFDKKTGNIKIEDFNKELDKLIYNKAKIGAKAKETQDLLKIKADMFNNFKKHISLNHPIAKEFIKDAHVNDRQIRTVIDSLIKKDGTIDMNKMQIKILDIARENNKLEFKMNKLGITSNSKISFSNFINKINNIPISKIVDKSINIGDKITNYTKTVSAVALALSSIYIINPKEQDIKDLEKVLLEKLQNETNPYLGKSVEPNKTNLDEVINLDVNGDINEYLKNKDIQKLKILYDKIKALVTERNIINFVVGNNLTKANIEKLQASIGLTGKNVDGKIGYITMGKIEDFINKNNPQQ